MWRRCSTGGPSLRHHQHRALGGRDRHWRRATRAALALKPGEEVLDLAAGTSVSTVELAKSGPGAWPRTSRWACCTPVQPGRFPGGRRCHPAAFGDATFDAVTISFGLRNVVDFSAGLKEMARVTRPGGRLVVCEFSTPTVPVFSRVYKGT